MVTNFKQISLSDAMRRRAKWLNDSQKTNSHMENGWGDKNTVVASLLEMADVIDSWGGEYLSKEDTEVEFAYRRYGRTDDSGVYHPGDYDAKPLTKEQRREYMKQKK